MKKANEKVLPDSEEVVTPLMLDGTYLSRNFATLGPMIRQPPCDLRSCAWLLHPNIKNQGKGMSEVNRFGDEERRLMHLVPAPAVRLMKRQFADRQRENRL